MNDSVSSSDLIPDLNRTADAVGRLAEDDTLFRAGIDAFRAQDAESFQQLLTRLKLGPVCELLCRWICTKECTLRCIELCGPPVGKPISIEEIPRFAEVIAKITSDEELIERLADAVERRDRDAFQSLVKELKIERFCHLLCHWTCRVHCRLACDVVCAPGPVVRRSLVSELGVAGAAIRSLLQNKQVLSQVIKAAVAVDCKLLSGLIGPGGRCIFICEWICSWRCVLVCLRLCRAFPPRIQASIEEMREFAQALARVAATEGALPRLADAVQSQNADAFATAVKELQVERFCLQFCHWICYEFCRQFCFCVCPEPETIPMFTHVGMYRVDPIWNDFGPDGTTTAGDLAFTATIPLIGILPDGATPTALEYRFRTEKYPLGGGPQDVTAAMIAPTVIGQLEYWAWDNITNAPVLQSANYWVNNPNPATNQIPIPQNGPPLLVSVNKTVAPDGWIEVPRENQLFLGGVGRFVPTGGLANLDTTALTKETFDLTVNAAPLPLKAGDLVPAAQESEKPRFKIYFEARKVLNQFAVSANNRDEIALSNTTYTYNRHPDWAGSPPPIVSTPVVSLDILELINAGGCSPLAGHIHALFTAYHPYLGSCEVYIQGPGVPPPPAVNPPISVDGQATSPAGGQDFDISTLQPCAYILWLTTTLNLTVGYGKLGGSYDDLIAFCTS